MAFQIVVYIARSKNGWMNSDIFEYLANVFLPELADKRRMKKFGTEEPLVLDDSDWVINWVDGYRSHLSVHASQLCEMNKIASHVCLPNDLGPFKPLKTERKSAVAEWKLNHP